MGWLAVEREHKDLTGMGTPVEKGLRPVDGQAEGLDGAAQRWPLGSILERAM
jgi:hypothetical protein